ncbi:WD40 repeat domain-containing serine/threonine protein kinase [Actinoallomurus rhizosphaericola]|uniref:WD40 repeat domain-containing serine/threonine protein kinase n=1 Tax=Actinoallomurus rhizosphaericola TaxID=2952536 RepID=UPI0020931E5A|nr:WD40 repeat domain-containing serine/threonine protein kinase [Actinoallomurus rhizosphaericola]MCO6000002.1 WD40 repeat domain-containing serine/threonine protein kinase [Actinoallomurus rhizosphaericola]
MAEPLLAGDPPQLGDYWLARRIDAGAQGVVYEGYDDAGHRVAVKALRVDALSDAARHQMRREVAVLRRLEPFCTARIIGADLDHTPPFVVSEYIPGPTLRSRVDGHGAYDPQALIRLAIGIATALASIHQAGVIHRDLKPENVIIGPDGPRVIDFGIARAADMSLSALDVKGTPRWMAPESFDHRPVSAAVDVWAWAAIVLYAATGTPPFGGRELDEIEHQVRTHRPLLDGLPARLRPLVGAALSHDPAARPTAAALLAGLVGPPASEGDQPLEEVLAAGLRRADDPDRTATDAGWPALGERAERLYQDLSDEYRVLVPRVLLRMISVAPDARHTLRKVPDAEFLDGDIDEEVLGALLEALRRGGLVVRDENRSALATPALVRAWPRLRAWTADDGAALNSHHDLADAARSWSDNGRKAGDLLQGTRLDQAIAWVVSGPRHATLNAVERAYLDASVAANERRRRNRTLLSITLAVLLVAVTSAGAVVFVQGRTLAARNRTVTRQRDHAVATQVTALAMTMRRSDPVTARRLAVAAADLDPGAFDTRNALETVYQQWEESRYRPDGVTGIYRRDTSGDWHYSVDATGRTIIFAKDHRLLVTDTDTRTIRRAITVPGPAVQQVSLSADGRTAALAQWDGFSSSRGGTVRTWDVTSGQPTGAAIPLSDSPYIRISRTGRYLYTPSQTGSAAWDTRTGAAVLRIPAADTSPAAIAALTFTPDERQLLIVTGRRMDLWDLRTGQKARSTHLDRAYQDAAYSPDGRRLALVDGNRLRVLRDGRTELNLTVPQDQQRGGEPAFSSDGRYLLLDSMIWDTTDRRDTPVFRYTDPGCLDQRIDLAGRSMRCVDAQGFVNVISLRTILDPISLGTTLAYALKLNFSGDGSTLAVRNGDHVDIWDTAARTRRTTLTVPRGHDQELPYTLSRDGTLLADMRSSGEIEVWNTRTGARQTSIKVASSFAPADKPPAFTPDGKTLVTLDSSYPSVLRFWDARSGRLLAASPGVKGGLGFFGQDRILISPDGGYVLSGPDQGRIQIPTGRRLIRPSDATIRIDDLGTGDVGASVDYPDKLAIWDTTTGRHLFDITVGTAFELGSPRFSPDGHLIADADDAGDVQIWDLESRQPLGAPLTGFYVPPASPDPRVPPPAGFVAAIGYSADGSTVYSVDSLGRLHTYPIGSQGLRQRLCAETGPLSPAEWHRYIRDVPYRRTC